MSHPLWADGTNLRGMANGTRKGACIDPPKDVGAPLATCDVWADAWEGKRPQYCAGHPAQGRRYPKGVGAWSATYPEPDAQ
jgi:hypothetical protein